MMLLIYVFSTLLVGVACLGALLLEARRPGATLARTFLVFWGALSVIVLGRLLLAYGVTVDASGPVWRVVDYAESFVGRYAVMFALPFFAHRVFGVAGRARDGVLAAVVLVALAGQHVTEFGLGGAWDEAGDVAEDVLFAVVVAYTLALGLGRFRSPATRRSVAVAFMTVLGLGLPVVVHDLFLTDGTTWRLYPLWYCVVSVVMTTALSRRTPGVAGAIPAAWGLSAAEERVARLVLEGRSNREIARELIVSPNTVKTQLRAVFDKSGHRSRVGLIAAVARGAREPGANHPDG